MHLNNRPNVLNNKNNRGPIYRPSLFSQQNVLPSLSLQMQGEEIKEMPLWGTNLPPEMIEWLRISARVDTTALPPAALISIHICSVDGAIKFQTLPEPINRPEPYQIQLPGDELLRFTGQDVDFSYLITLGSEESVIGDSRRVHIRQPLEYSSPVIEGVNEHGLIVANYPNGLDIDLSAIKNIQSFSDINCHWNVVIQQDNGLTLLYSRRTVVPSTDNAYRFRIPAEAYTGYPPEAFAIGGVDTNIFPRGASNWSWGFGGNDHIVLI